MKINCLLFYAIKYYGLNVKMIYMISINWEVITASLIM